MSNNKNQIKTFKKVYPQIYSYILPDRLQNNGWQKVGYTERKDVNDRIREQNETASHKERYIKQWSAPAIKVSGEWFKDYELHRYFQQNQIRKDEGRGAEWFYFNGEPNKSKELFDAFCQNTFSKGGRKTPYVLRQEQEDAVEQTLQYAQNNQTTDFNNPNEKAEFLWNAKPRFGKTLTTYEFMKRFNASKTLIVTNRPAIADSWYSDFNNFIDGYYFISTADSIKEKTLTRDEFNRIDDINKKQVTFLSLQDLKGSRAFGGTYDKLQWVADLDWDLLVIDEAHEGVETDKTDAAFENIKRRFILHLSGTPFRALAEGRFSSQQIYNWTYLDEQKAKQVEIADCKDSGAHTDMPDLRLFNYRISDITAKQIEEGIDVNGENIPPVFEFNDFFATNTKGEFKRKADVWRFLNTLTDNEGYPFSTPELREELKHTFWFVGNRVSSAKAMEKLLKKHPVFENYKIVLAAGDGRSLEDEGSEEEAGDFKKNEKALARVKKAIKENDKTITLSVGQLTTGVTIKEWSAVLMLSDVKQETLYTQAIFRAQNPYKYEKDGQLYRKKSAYVFDFSPYRVLEIYDKLANSLIEKGAIGNLTEVDRKDNVAELLNFFPVIAQDEHGKMIELDASELLTLPAAKMASDIVRRGFITNLLFKDIGNVFNIPSEIAKRLNKLPNSKEDGSANKKDKRDITNNREREEQKQKHITTNRNIIWGQKVYGEPIREAFEQALEDVTNFKQRLNNTIKDDILHEPLAKYIETYAPTKKEQTELNQKIEQKINEISEEFINSNKTEKDKTEAIDSLAEFIEEELPRDTVDKREENEYEEEAKTELDIIREKLRTFSRAIPSFVMAAKNPKNLTIDNLEEAVSDEDFETLFNERDKLHTPDRFTKADFIELRDGGDYEENGKIVHFDGFFEKYRFNAAIQEFGKKRQQLADYLNNQTKEDIFSYIPAQKSNQIFTPRDVVNKMLNALEAENPGIFSNPNLTFCDLYVKSGLFITETAKRLDRGLAHVIPDRQARLKHIFENQLFGFAPTQIIYDIAANYIYGGFPEISRQNLKKQDLTERFKRGEDLHMKFDVVIGNPPYNDDAKQQIYTGFYVNALKIADNVCMIFPVGWQEPKNANGLRKMNNPKIKYDSQIVQIDNRRNVFDNVAGAEWTNIILWKRFYNNGLNGKQKILTEGKDPQEVKLLIDKVDKEKPAEIVEMARIVEAFPSFVSAQTITSVLKPYGLRTDVIKDPSKYGLPSLNKEEGEILVYGKSGEKYYVSKDYPFPRVSKGFKKYKVFVGYAWGNMSEKTGLGGAYSDIIIGEPFEACIETYQEQGAFENKKEAKYQAKYIMTKFARALLYKNKHSQHSTTAWVSVPVQDFSEPWWDLSIEEIDKKLMKKYNIPENIQEFVFENIQKRSEENIVNI